MLGNYFKPTSKTILKLSLALKGFIGTISAATYFDGNKTAAFWFLIAGAFIDFILQCVDSDTEQAVKDNAGKITVILALLWLSLFGCKTSNIATSTTKVDSIWTSYNQAVVNVSGDALRNKLSTAASSSHPANIDSMINAAVSAFKDEMKSKKPIEVTDPESKVQLKYWYDQFCTLNMECSSKDQTIQLLIAQINKLSTEKKVENIIIKEPTWYTWGLVGYSLAFTVLLVILIFFKR
jgi:hypothetical protein